MSKRCQTKGSVRPVRDGMYCVSLHSRNSLHNWMQCRAQRRCSWGGLDWCGCGRRKADHNDRQQGRGEIPIWQNVHTAYHSAEIAAASSAAIRSSARIFLFAIFSVKARPKANARITPAFISSREKRKSAGHALSLQGFTKYPEPCVTELLPMGRLVKCFAIDFNGPHGKVDQLLRLR